MEKKSERLAPPPSPPPDAAPPSTAGCSAASGHQEAPLEAVCIPHVPRPLSPAGCAGLPPFRHRSRASAASRAWSSREGPRAAGRVSSPCLAARGLAGPAPALRSPGPDRKRRRTAWAWRGGRALGPGRTWARSTRSTSRTGTSTRVRSDRPACGAAPPLPARPRPAEMPRRGGVRPGPAGPGGCSWDAGRWGARPRSAPGQPAPCCCFRVRGEAPKAGPQSGWQRSH